ncbi:YciI family protein [Blastococcus sp. Marseille-P5729]|uniref:YciI family protein n=1 Tax=Blastococcus sp. Marseille-P5729 TaxID=2086582 RepID=UPI000D0F684B|nr:YciI family protein [Blastococcus sp. Marseille-P5729]
MRYLVQVISGAPDPAKVSHEQIQQTMQAYDVYTKALANAGVLVAAEALHPADTATTVRGVDGDAQVQDGPYADTKEALATLFLIDVPDLDAALDWAKRCPGASYAAVEVRAAASSFIDGAWRR